MQSLVPTSLDRLDQLDRHIQRPQAPPRPRRLGRLIEAVVIVGIIGGALGIDQFLERSERLFGLLHRLKLERAVPKVETIEARRSREQAVEQDDHMLPSLKRCCCCEKTSGV